MDQKNKNNFQYYIVGPVVEKLKKKFQHVQLYAQASIIIDQNWYAKLAKIDLNVLPKNWIDLISQIKILYNDYQKEYEKLKVVYIEWGQANELLSKNKQYESDTLDYIIGQIQIRLHALLNALKIRENGQYFESIQRLMDTIIRSQSLDNFKHAYTDYLSIKQNIDEIIKPESPLEPSSVQHAQPTGWSWSSFWPKNWSWESLRKSTEYQFKKEAEQKNK
jgi:hypothetical protein